MPVQVFPSVAVIVLGISAIGAGTWLVDKYIDPRVGFFKMSLLFFFARISIARSSRDDQSRSLSLFLPIHKTNLSYSLSVLNSLSNPYNHQNKTLHLKIKNSRFPRTLDFIPSGIIKCGLEMKG